MVVKFTVALSSSGYTLYSFGLPSRKALSLINLVLNVLKRDVSQECLQGLLSTHGAPFLKDQMICSTLFQTRKPGKKSSDAAAQTEIKLYPSLTLV